MDWLLNILSNIGSIVFVVFFFGACIFIHELGHFLAAKWRGLHIDAFSIGFRTVWHKKVGKIDYRIGWLPFGGYCELPQVDSSSDEIKDADGNLLPRAKPLDRIITAFAGPFFNIIFGFFIASFVWYFGLPSDVEQSSFEVAALVEKSPEYRSGLRDGDLIVKLNEKEFKSTFGDFAQDIMLTAGTVSLSVVRGNESVSVQYVPESNPDAPGILKHEKIAWPFFSVRPALVIKAGSPLALAGAKTGDLLLSINGIDINSEKALTDYMQSLQEIKSTDLTVRRNGEIITLKVLPEKVDIGESIHLTGITFNQDSPIVSDINTLLPAAGKVKVGDKIVSVDNTTFANNVDLVKFIRSSNGRTLDFNIERDGKTIQIQITPAAVIMSDFGLEFTTIKHPTPVEVFKNTTVRTYQGLKSILLSAGRALGLTETSTSIGLRHMSGPISISTTLYGVVHNQSMVRGLYFVAFISFALALFNLLPLPVLDGGFIVLSLLEIVFGKPLPQKVFRYLYTVFFVLLISLMLTVTIFDFRRLGFQSGLLKDTNTEEPSPIKTENAK